MKRLFGKGGKRDGSENAESKEEVETTETPQSDPPKTKKKSQKHSSESEGEPAPPRQRKPSGGEGDAEKVPRRRRDREAKAKKNEQQQPPRPSKRRERRRQNSEDNESDSSKPRKSSTSQLKAQHSKDTISDEDDVETLHRKPQRSRSKFTDASKKASENESESDEDKENIVSALRESKEATKKERRQQEKKPVEKGQSSTSLLTDSRDEFSQFMNKNEMEHLNKIEPEKGGYYLSTLGKYRKPIAGFKLRARILKYPTFSDRDTWPGDFAVVDERIFGWQEKIFSPFEAKKYQKLENCITEKEQEYHERIVNYPDSIGKNLYSYITDDPYVARKKEKYLTRRCPVPHIRKAKNGSHFSIDGKSVNSDAESLGEGLLGELSGSDSIDFDEPVSSSTPKTRRKEAKMKSDSDKKESQKKEKELKEQERRSRKLQEAKKKKEKLEEKKKMQREAKQAEDIKKLKEVEVNEQERKDEYIKKYKYSKRPSLPVGARLRSVQLTPSPRKLTKRQKSRVMSRSSEFSTDYQDEKESDGSSKSKKDDSNDGKTDRKESVTDSLTMPHHDEKAKASRRVDHEHSDVQLISYQPRRKSLASKSQRKFQDRFSYKNSQTMFIMASVPHLPGRCREVVVCMIRNLSQQGLVVFKPALGYRNLEAKRNHIYRLTCEPYLSDSLAQKDNQQAVKERYAVPKDTAADDFLGLFELAPKNELRLTVMGEITTVHGFESSPLCVYYVVDIPKGWRNDSLSSNMEGITHTCYSDQDSVAHFSHEFSFHMSFSMDSVEEGNSYPTPVIAFMVTSMAHPSPRIVYEGYGYLCIPMTPGCHYAKVKTWKPRPRSIVEKMRATFLNITPSLQDMKFAHIPHSEYEEFNKANLIGLQTEPSGSVKFRLHVIHQTPTLFKNNEKKLDMLEKMSSATILKSVQAVIEAFQRAREKAASLKNQHNTVNV